MRVSTRRELVRRLSWGLAAGGILCVAAVVVALANPAKRGSGRIFFGHSVEPVHLAIGGAGKTISTSTRGFAFKAFVVKPSYIPVKSGSAVDAEFDRWTHRHTWQPIWRVRAQVPSGSDTILAKNYKLRFIERKGVRPFGYYRMIIFGRHHRWLAHGRFWLVH